MEEVWKDIVGYEGRYQVSNFGNVKSLNYRAVKGREHSLSKKHHHTGYDIVMLCNGSVYKNKAVHSLVAEAFIPNPRSLPCVNHIDGNKRNNNVENLEWISHKENTRHAIRTGLFSPRGFLGVTGARHPSSKKVLQYSKDGTFIKEWASARDVARAFGCNSSTIGNVCSGRIKTAKGYIWKHAEG